MSSSIFSTGVRGVTHFRTTSGRVYVTSSAPNALQVLSAIDQSNLSFVTTSSGGLGVVNFDNTSGIANWLRVNGSQLFVHCCNTSNFGVIKGNGWNTSGINNRNTCVGIGTGKNIISTAIDNTIVGHLAGTSLTSGDRNTIVGTVAGRAFTTQNDNIIISNYVYNASGTGSRLIFIANVLPILVFSTSLYVDTILMSNTMTGTGGTNSYYNNCVIGGGGLTSASGGLVNVTYIDNNPLLNIGLNGANNYTFLGSQVTSIPTTNNTFAISPTNLPATGAGVAVNITTSGQVVRTASAKKYKTEVSEYNLNSNFIYDLSGKFFYLNADEFQTRRIGYLAEDLMNIPNASNHVICDINCSEGCVGPESIDYYSMLVPVIEQMKIINNNLTDLENRLTIKGY